MYRCCNAWICPCAASATAPVRWRGCLESVGGKTQQRYREGESCLDTRMIACEDKRHDVRLPPPSRSDQISAPSLPTPSSAHPPNRHHCRQNHPQCRHPVCPPTGSRGVCCNSPSPLVRWTRRFREPRRKMLPSPDFSPFLEELSLTCAPDGV